MSERLQHIKAAPRNPSGSMISERIRDIKAAQRYRSASKKSERLHDIRAASIDSSERLQLTHQSGSN
ncbi:Hypothetical protein NTJ_14928 [Nesidiocoris tenuis]|uniref:Uncharacterized protein n=1 Tax=Nesidiocoris tenuis TaxID=355587 RepID=A0ABN7BE24_9HEMI|nr:Hypothetical protein NTJ_14928 [Nesidiocoris tenuis]